MPNIRLARPILKITILFNNLRIAYLDPKLVDKPKVSLGILFINLESLLKNLTSSVWNEAFNVRITLGDDFYNKRINLEEIFI